MKKLLALFGFICLLVPLSAQEADAESMAAALSDYEADTADDADVAADDADDFFDLDEFDELFADAEDIDEGIVTETKSGAEATVHIANTAIALRLSGSLSSSLGVGMIREDGDSKGTGYFDFYNYLYLYARPDKYMIFRATVETSFPGQASNPVLRFKELYFDYLLLDKVYITAGKKGTTWGYTRLFSTDFEDAKRADALVGISTNILSDSINGVSGIVRIPLWTGTLSGVVLYNGGGTDIDMKELTYAGSVEMTIRKTSLNVFGRKNPSGGSPHLVGIEAKRTIFGTDIYAQDISQFVSVRELRHVLSDKNVFTKHLVTAGLYRWWDNNEPHVGFNVEFQGEYVPSTDTFYKRIYFDGGIKRLGPKKNIKVGVAWNHQFDGNTGYVKPGVIVSGVFPHADWDTGVKIEYGDALKYTLGTYLKLSLSY